MNNINTDDESGRVDLGMVYKYVSSLQDSVRMWYKIFNPFDSDFDDQTKIWLDRIDRIGPDGFLPLILTFMQNVESKQKVQSFLRVVERHKFVLGLFDRVYFSGLRGIGGDVVDLAVALNKGEILPEKVTQTISEWTSSILKHPDASKEMVSRFKNEGFYGWSLIRYFLYEYNAHLQSKSKTQRVKIDWREFSESRDDFVSVEHIYPQQARNPYWVHRFSHLTQKQKAAIRNSLGNLLPLSSPKNSSLSNKPFDEKVSGVKNSYVGYRYGSYAENEVTKYDEWSPDTILERGLKMISFLEERWAIDIVDDRQRKSMLGIDFM